MRCDAPSPVSSFGWLPLPDLLVGDVLPASSGWRPQDDRLSDASELRSTVGHRRESLLNQSSSSGHSSSSSKSAEESRGRGSDAKLDCDSNPSSARASDAKEEQVAQVLPSPG